MHAKTRRFEETDEETETLPEPESECMDVQLQLSVYCALY
jgi:hypothetical protein